MKPTQKLVSVIFRGGEMCVRPALLDEDGKQVITSCPDACEFVPAKSGTYAIDFEGSGQGDALIACAAELLEACESLLDALQTGLLAYNTSPGEEAGRRVAAARAAIAKAKGEA